MGDSVTEDEVVCEIETDKVWTRMTINLKRLIYLNRRGETLNLCVLLFVFAQTSVQVPAPAAGVIEELLVPDGGKVEGGTPLFKLRKGGELN